jgi:hypothetical protein
VLDGMELERTCSLNFLLKLFRYEIMNETSEKYGDQKAILLFLLFFILLIPDIDTRYGYKNPLLVNLQSTH